MIPIKMDPYSQHLANRLQEREQELEKLHSSFCDVRNKFMQLENAFQINLQTQQDREDEINLLRLESHDYRKLDEESAKSRAELASRLMKAISESDHWKKAFMQQKRTNKLEHENFIASVKKECEDILQVTRSTAEKHFRELVQLYQTERGKSDLLQKQMKIFQQKYRNKQERILELANLLETLAQFNVNVESVCQNAAEVMRNFEEHDIVHVEKMRKLRQLTWEAGQIKFQDQEQLRIQNSVLREIVKSLKKKLQIANSCSESRLLIPEKDESPECINPINFSGYRKPANFSNESEKMLNNYMTPECNQTSKSFDNPQKLNGPSEYQSPGSINQKIKINAINARKRKETKFSRDSREKDQICLSPHIEKLESHLNGVPYQEYVIRFSKNHEMKVKHSSIPTSGEFPLKIEFVDDEEEYQDASLDKIYIFLKNIERVIRLKKNGMNCGVQTTRVKISNSYAQTMLTKSTNSFSRLNVGATMLNSEKRAIERCLSKLERTVADLKFNAAYQARPMTERDSKYEKNEEYLGVRFMER
ncbi:uncharacterized protein LOC117169513 [Belonocnema kinseyi]|uniref:uncharacterized protein LOC117169513 n=1 Tax=Belonocnema kinseyi TaxID=2817044 RepID=UPI00143DDE00|nr:uncharacterized protein LOC117169513 [Belonocnema kinseyi]